MKIIITAGGTTEQIDSVRTISNISTGRLGSLIANAFSVLPDVDEIYYLCNKASIQPQADKVKIFHVNNVADLEFTIKSIFAVNDIDIIIHSMAVSDYRVKSVTSAFNLANTMISRQGILKNINEEDAESLITSLLDESKSVIGGNGKISSSIDNMLLVMERTPKIISMFQKISPQSILVGFKLLDDVQYEVLIDTAFDILQENRCSFVLANDLRDIDNDNHIGYLINRHKEYDRFTTKEEIASAIVAASIAERKNLK